MVRDKKGFEGWSLVGGAALWRTVERRFAMVLFFWCENIVELHKNNVFFVALAISLHSNGTEDREDN